MWIIHIITILAKYIYMDVPTSYNLLFIRFHFDYIITYWNRLALNQITSLVYYYYYYYYDYHTVPNGEM